MLVKILSWSARGPNLVLAGAASPDCFLTAWLVAHKEAPEMLEVNDIIYTIVVSFTNLQSLSFLMKSSYGIQCFNYLEDSSRLGQVSGLPLPFFLMLINFSLWIILALEFTTISLINSKWLEMQDCFVNARNFELRSVYFLKSTKWSPDEKSTSSL